MFFRNASSLARFAPDKMGKTTIAQGDFLFAGLNCFEPGQEHAPHAHEGQDKLYVIIEGAGTVTIGEETEYLSAGDVAFAPPPGPARLVVLAVLAPPPRSTQP